MKMTEKKNRRQIPAFANYEEEAAFWDTHDFGDFWEETEPVEIVFSKQLSTNFTVRLSPATLKLLRKHAERKGIAPSTLARMWLVERLREDEANKTRQTS
jgi:predicted glycoside hydrolase/deacetylase ChbG (UPF0249 family)